MTIGIIIAFEKEFNTFIKYITKTKTEKIKNIKIISGFFNNKKIILTKSGIGKTSSAIASTLIINKYSIKKIINIGSAGILKKIYKFKDIIIIKKFYYHDVNITTFNYKLGEIPNLPKNFKSNKKLLKKIIILLKEKTINFHLGNIATGDTFITNKSKNKIKKSFPKIICVDMEATSIAHTCYIFNIPFICIKIISDKSNKKSKKDFKNNIIHISEIIFNLLNIILNKI